MNGFATAVLLAIVVIPLVAGLAIRPMARRNRARVIGAIAAGLGLVLAIAAAWSVYGGHAGDLWRDRAAHPWLAIDEFSAALLVLEAVASLAILVAAPSGALDARMASAVLLVEATTQLAFCAVDDWLLVSAWTAALVPCWLEIRRVEGSEGRVARRVFALYMFGSSVAFAAGVVWLTAVASRAGIDAPMSMPALAAAGLSTDAALPAIALLSIAVVLRAGLVPLHSWLPALSEIVHPLVLLPILVPQLGAYLLVRLIIAPFPGALESFVPSIADLALITAVYGALLGLTQRYLRRIVACLVMSQSAVVFVGLECDNVEGVAGGMMLWLAAGLATTGFVLTVVAVLSRIGPRKLDRFTGLVARAPLLTALFLVLGLASVSLPGTLGFAGEDMLVHGVLETFPSAGIAIFVAGAANGYNVLRAFTFLFLGPAPSDLPHVGPLLRHERWVLVAIVAMLVIGGLAPGPVVALRSEAARELVQDRPGAPTH